MFVEVGPASVVITGEKDGGTFDFDEEEVRNILTGIISGLRDHLPVLRQKGNRVKRTDHMSVVAKTMVEAVKEIDGTTLTPMAAVAGAVADGVRDALRAKGPDFLSVNNGGDISVFNRTGRKVNVGLGDIGTGETSPYVLRIEGCNKFGLATSGFGGRSLTMGLADMVTIMARTGAIADAAATYVCNMTNVETDNVVRKKAKEIDPLTDIPDEWVTVKIGPLDDLLLREALMNGLSAAQALKDRGTILDAVIVLKGRLVATRGGKKNICVEVDYGSQKAGYNHRGDIC